MPSSWPSRLLFVFVIVASTTILFAQSPTRTRAQSATPVPPSGTWHAQVNNVSPTGEKWSFETFYPDRLRAHPGDTIVFTLAENPLAYHTVMVLAQGLTPMEMYQGFAGGFLQPDLGRSGRWQSTIFTDEAYTPCGRAGQDPCLIAHVDDVDFGANSGVLVNPPPDGGAGNTSFTVTLDPHLPLGPYYVTSIVDGPTMSARIDREGLLDTTLTASVTPARLASQQAIMSVYEGTFPGPTLRVRPGDTVRIDLVNRLGDSPAGLPQDSPFYCTPLSGASHGGGANHGTVSTCDTNLHLHGLHVSPSGNADNVFLRVAAGEAFQYEYHITDNHPAGLYWYHPHLHGTVTTQVFGGMVGAALGLLLPYPAA